MNPIQMTKIDPPEPRRIYHFPHGTIEIADVVGVCVRPSGNHRIETKGGRKFIVQPGWNAIELIGVESWTM